MTRKINYDSVQFSNVSTIWSQNNSRILLLSLIITLLFGIILIQENNGHAKIIDAVMTYSKKSLKFTFPKMSDSKKGKNRVDIWKLPFKKKMLWPTIKDNIRKLPYKKIFSRHPTRVDIWKFLPKKIFMGNTSVIMPSLLKTNDSRHPTRIDIRKLPPKKNFFGNTSVIMPSLLRNNNAIGLKDKLVKLLVLAYPR